MLLEPTIAAIATAPGAAGIGVIRVSGELAWQIGKQLLASTRQIEAGRFYHGWVVNPENADETIDEVLLLVFKTPQSFTGEDVIEIHCHGSDVICQQILELCIQQGARHAEPGEFSKRAFLNGKIDLLQAESIMDLVSANATNQTKLATANLKNRSLSTQLEQLRQRLIETQAPIVASVDFPEEVDEPNRRAIAKSLDTENEWIASLLARSAKNQVIRDGYRVALLGRPNAGKSALFNALLAQDRAIVTDIAGTTRDVLTEGFSLNGIHVTLMDTAGIRESENQVEVLGIARTWNALDEANAVLYIVDLQEGVIDEDLSILKKLSQHHRLAVVGNKQDAAKPEATEQLQENAARQALTNALIASATTGHGLPGIYQWITEGITQTGIEASQGAVSLNTRQHDCLETLTEHLRDAKSSAEQVALPIDVITVPLTDAIRQIDTILGNDPTEAVLDSVFAQFCVGK